LIRAITQGDSDVVRVLVMQSDGVRVLVMQGDSDVGVRVLVTQGDSDGVVKSRVMQLESNICGFAWKKALTLEWNE